MTNSSVRTAFGPKDLINLIDRDGTFGVMSAYISDQPKSENKAAHGKLVAELQRLGLRYENLKGSWERKTEKSVLITNVSFDVMAELSAKFSQDAFIFKDPTGTVGIYFLDGTAQVSAGDKVDVSSGDDLYSKGRGVSFSVGEVVNMSWTDGPIDSDDYMEAVREAA